MEARDLAAVRNSLEEMAAKQEQMVQSIPTLQAVVEQYIQTKDIIAASVSRSQPPHAAR